MLGDYEEAAVAILDPVIKQTTQTKREREKKWRISIRLYTVYDRVTYSTIVRVCVCVLRMGNRD